MRRRRKKDFTKQVESMDAYVGQWVANLSHDDTELTMGYGPDGPELTFWHPSHSYMVAHIFEGVSG